MIRNLKRVVDVLNAVCLCLCVCAIVAGWAAQRSLVLAAIILTSVSLILSAKE